jgi:Secretion system C-terminal sorting domain/Right handed beta helix region
MKQLFYIFSFSMCLFFATAQTNYYVATNGTNTNNGSLAQPWLNLQYAINQLQSGDTLNIRQGTYSEKILIAGAVNNTITIRNHNTEAVLLSAAILSSSNPIIEINSKNGITIKGLEIANFLKNDAQGILIHGSSDNITIENNKIHDIHFSTNPNAAVNANTNAQALIVFGDIGNDAITNLKIKGNAIYNCRLGYSEGLAVNGNVDGFEVSNNIVHDITNIGIVAIGHEGTCPVPANDQARNGLIKNNTAYNCLSPYATSGGIYVDGGKDIVIESNTTYHNGFGIEIGCENIGKTASNIVARSNFIYDNEMAGIALGGYAFSTSGSGKVTNSKISNNSLLKNGYAVNAIGELFLSYSENTIIDNNIFYVNTQNLLGATEQGQPNISMAYNLYYGVAGANNFDFDKNGTVYNSYATFVSGTLSFQTNASFANPNYVSVSIPNPNLHLQSGSPAINTGNPSYVMTALETDIDNEVRVALGIIDKGADETSSVPISIQNKRLVGISNEISIYPNPFQDKIKIETAYRQYNVTITDLSGKVLVQVIDIHDNALDLSQLNSGVYFLHFKDTNTGNIKQMRISK